MGSHFPEVNHFGTGQRGRTRWNTVQVTFRLEDRSPIHSITTGDRERQTVRNMIMRRFASISLSATPEPIAARHSSW